jgi:signal transduction histidine kinase
MHENSGHGPVRCWEWLSCGRSDCDVHDSTDLQCWLVPGNRCFDGDVGLTERLLTKCSSCPVFTVNRERAGGKRFADGAVINTLDALFQELADLTSRIQTIQAESTGKTRQVAMLSEVGRALQSTMEIEDLLGVILAAVTAGNGLGLNRAFLLLVDEGGTNIRGRMAVGPTNSAEAGAIWKAMEHEGRSLREILSSRKPRDRVPDKGIMGVCADLVFPLDAADNVVVRSLDEGVSFIVDASQDEQAARRIAGILGNDHFLIVPLVAEGRKLGAIIADNFVTGRRIRSEDVRLLETFASQAALAIVNASLHRNLQKRHNQLEDAHRELSQNHIQLLRAERLVALGGLAASFIHDLKAPLVSIGLMARAAAAKLNEEDATRESLEKIASEIVEVEDYLKGLAKTATRGADKTTVLDISGVLENSLELMRGSFLTRNIDTVVNMGHDRVMVRGSWVEFRQMVLNLLHNAVEAMPDGGTLTVATGVEDNMMSITIKDTGPGVPEEARSRVFSAFFTTKPEGSGLGLFIVRRIVRDHGGKISFESREGEGTCFTIQLPVSSEPG